MTWPIEQAVYGSFQYFLREVGGAMGHGYDPSGWDHEKESIIESVVQRGVQMFYAPSPLPGEKFSHEWSFLKPIWSFSTVSDTYIYDLPDDFSSIEGPMTYAPGSSVLFEPINIVSEHQLRIRQEMGTTTGRPVIAAIRPKALDPTLGTRYEILLWPTADQIYTIEATYRVSPLFLTLENNFPYGGHPHVETILASCLVAASNITGANIESTARILMERMQASISFDRKHSSPENLGYNRDRSDFAHTEYFPNWHRWNQNLTTYEGVQY